MGVSDTDELSIVNEGGRLLTEKTDEKGQGETVEEVTHIAKRPAGARPSVDRGESGRESVLSKLRMIEGQCWKRIACRERRVKWNQERLMISIVRREYESAKGSCLRGLGVEEARKEDAKSGPEEMKIAIIGSRRARVQDGCG